jgi:RNA recognition motif-containing protein
MAPALAGWRGTGQECEARWRGIAARARESSMRIDVGNLSRDVRDEDLRQVFELFGAVTSVEVLTDPFTGQSRGFGFVEMPSQTAAQAAIAGFHGTPLQGRARQASEARAESFN